MARREGPLCVEHVSVNSLYIRQSTRQIENRGTQVPSIGLWDSAPWEGGKGSDFIDCVACASVYVQSLQRMTVQCSSPRSSYVNRSIITNKSAYRIRVGEFTYHFGLSPDDPFDDTPRTRFACIPSRVYCVTHFTLPESGNRTPCQPSPNSQISSEDSHMCRRRPSR
jgi:hypothetical protein